MIRMLIAVITLLFGIMGGGAHADTKDIYRPYAHGFPQIIQEFDYSTIEAVEALFVELKRFPKGDMDCLTTGASIILKRSGSHDGKVVVSVPENGPVIVSKRPYKNRKTLVLFTTLRKILTELSMKDQCRGVQYDQFSTRAYRKRSIIEFDFGSKVVVLDAFSNGSKDDERLYVLDLVDKKESYFWGKI